MQTTALQMEGEKIAAIYITRNPDKLLHMKEARSAIDRA
jgi:RNA polymerase sigma-70 factor (ECF subfamily)